MTQVADDYSRTEDHCPGVAVLVAVAVDLEPHVEILRVLYLVSRDQPRADGPEGVASFALVPLTASLELECALGYVVADAITGDVISRLVLGHIGSVFADDDRQFDLPIQLVAVQRLTGMPDSAA